MRMSPRRGNSRSRIRYLLIDRQACVEVTAHQVPQFGLSSGRKQIESQPGGADGVRLLDNHLPTRVEARRRPGERERDQQAQEREDRAFDRAQAGPRPLLVPALATAAKPPTDFEQQDHADEHPAGKQERNQIHIHA